MQIALTKKLADALGEKPPTLNTAVDPIYLWTANWTNVWSNRRSEDMLVLVNHAARFTVAIYQVKRKDLKNIGAKINAAIANTLLAMNLNPEMVEDYMRLGGEVTFVKNSDRQKSSWVSKAGLECAIHVGYRYSDLDKMYSDIVGVSANYQICGTSASTDGGFYPYQEMIAALSAVTGMAPYKYRAFELLITLDLGIYPARRRLIVPAELTFFQFHHVIQKVFNWHGYHLYDFTFFNGSQRKRVVHLVPFEEDREFEPDAILMADHRLSEYLPFYSQLCYTYDMGDNWEHDIKLLRVIEDYDQESPYLLEASGQAPPEDVGGVMSYVEFYKIMQNPKHPEYSETKEWAGYWQPELADWNQRPRVVHID